MSDAVATIIVGSLSFLAVLFGTYAGIRKSSVLTVYRLEQLEKVMTEKTGRNESKIERLCDHTNRLETRADVMEEKIKVVNHRVDDLEKPHA